MNGGARTEAQHEAVDLRFTHVDFLPSVVMFVLLPHLCANEVATWRTTRTLVRA